MKNLTDQRFGKLIALRPTEMRDKASGIIWECKCDCGNIVYVSQNSLTRNQKRSCGCLQKVRQNDLVGNTYGRLTVIGKSEQQKNQKTLWECKCECGNTILVRGGSLISGATKSCGCGAAEIGKKYYKNNLSSSYIMGTKIDFLRADETKLGKSNTSGIKGVYYSTRDDRYIAFLTFRGQTFRKSCKTLQEAAVARRKMKQVHEEFLEWWDSLSEEDKIIADQEFRNDKEKVNAMMKKRISEL